MKANMKTIKSIIVVLAIIASLSISSCKTANSERTYYINEGYIEISKDSWIKAVKGDYTTIDYINLQSEEYQYIFLDSLQTVALTSCLSLAVEKHNEYYECEKDINKEILSFEEGDSIKEHTGLFIHSTFIKNGSREAASFIFYKDTKYRISFSIDSNNITEVEKLIKMLCS